QCGRSGGWWVGSEVVAVLGSLYPCPRVAGDAAPLVIDAGLASRRSVSAVMRVVAVSVEQRSLHCDASAIRRARTAQLPIVGFENIAMARWHLGEHGIPATADATSIRPAMKE